MNFNNMNKIYKVLFYLVIIVSLVSCHNRNPRKIVGLTGWNSKDKSAVGFYDSKVGYRGQTAPPGKRMGHAGAIISGGKGDAASKKAFLSECGVSVADSPAEMAEALLKIWQP